MGNCLDRNLSDEDERPIANIESLSNLNLTPTTHSNNSSSSSRRYISPQSHRGEQGHHNTHQAQSNEPVYYLTPNVQRTAGQLTEEEQIKLLKRMALIQQLPSGKYDANKKNKECVICMIEFEINDTMKFLPCLHTFHQACIDDWLIRSLICPSCMEPVDAGLLSAYENE